MNTCLSYYDTLPKLVEGKVCIVSKGFYSLHSVAKAVKIEDNFNPLNYSILSKDSKWGSVIVYSQSYERESYLMYKQLEQRQRSLYTSFKKGDKVHIHSLNGTYTILEFLDNNQVRIGCHKWSYEKKTKVVDRSDLKCKQGFRSH